MPPVLAEGEAPDRSLAVGPFTNLRSFGWIDGKLAWGWGDLADGRQVFFTLGSDGSVSAVETPATDQLASATPLPDGRGCVGVHYADFTGWYHPVEGEPVALGPAEALKLSPSGGRLLCFAPGDVRCVDTSTWEGTPQPEIPAAEFPFAGAGVEWIDDSLVAVRLWEPAGGPLGLDPDTGIIRLVQEPEGTVAGDLISPGDILAPFPSPDGRWLAVLHIDGSTAVVLPEDLFPLNAGLEVRVYARDDLAHPALAPARLLVPQEGRLVTSLLWSSDGTKLAYAESLVLPGGPDDSGLRLAGDRQVKVALAPDFAPQALDLGRGDWAPVTFSPAGRYLVAADQSTGHCRLVDLDSGRATLLPEGLSPDGLAWAGEELLCGTLDGGADPGRMVLVKVATGGLVYPSWPPSGSCQLTKTRVVYRAQVGPDGRLGPFSGASEGEWLVVAPVKAG